MKEKKKGMKNIMVTIRLENISKSYGKIIALKNITLEIKDREYFIKIRGKPKMPPKYRIGEIF